MRLSALIFCFLCAQATNTLQAQPSQVSQDVLQLVPPDGVALVTVQVKSITHDESFRMIPWEVISTLGKQTLGFDPLTLERVDVIACTPGVALRIGGMLTFQEDLPADITERFEKQDVQANKGVELYTLPGNPEVNFYKRDARHVIVGTRPFVLASAKTKPTDGPLRQLTTGLGESEAVSIVVALEPIREVMASTLQSPPIPAPLLKDMETIVSKSDMLAIRVNLGNTTTMATLIQTKSPTDAPEVSAALSRLVKVGTGAMVASVQQQAASAEGRVPPAAVAYLQRLAPEIEKNAVFKVTGNRLLLTLDGTQMVAGQVGIGVGLLLPAVQAARDAARRMQSQNNIKQMLLGILNYEATFKKFPMDKDMGLDMKSQYKMEPNLSWRVHILPFLEQGALYKEFHLDEAWDSPHNKKLLERMPDVYRHPQSNARPGYTVYQQPTGKGLFQTPGVRSGFNMLTDGSSNTACIVETTDEVSVPWTKPGDVNPLEDLTVFRNEKGQFNVGFADGSVQSFSVTTPDVILKAILTRDGGEVVELP